MKIKIQHLFSLLTVFAGIHQASAQGTAFTYEGQLNRSGSPANGNYDFTFALFNNSSTNSGQVGNRLTNLDVGVTNGLFTVTMNFGAVFTGNATWLAIGVRSNGGSSFTALSPLQELTPTPYAIYAPNAGSAASANSVAATNITGPIALAQLPAGLVTNNETNVTLGNVTLSGQFNGSGTFSNIWTPTYENYVAPYPIDRSGPDTWNTWAYSGSDWGLYDGSYGTNSEQWLTNAILAMAGVSNNAAFNKTYRTIWLTDGTFQGLDVNGNLTNDSRVFTHSWPFYTGLAHSNNAKLVVYLSFATNTCGGFPVGGLGHLYKDITNLMTWGFDGAQIDDCYFTTGGDYLGTPPYYDACMKQMNQAIVDYTASHTNAQGFSLMLTMYGGDSSWGSVLPSQFFGAQTLGSPAPIYGSTALDMAAALYYTQNYPWLTGYGHNMQLDSFYGVPQYNTADTSSNLFAISAMTHQQIRFSYGCTGKYNCPPTINSFSAYSGFFNEYLLNPTFLQIWNDNVAMPTFLTYTNTNTYILQEPLGSLNSSNHAVLIVNLNMGTGQDAVIPVNVANFNGCSNTSYVATEVFSGSVIATFTNQFTYDAGTNTCTLMTVCPNSQVLSGIQQINLPTPSGFSSSIVQNSLLTTGIGPNLVISGFQGLELDGQDYGVTVNDNFTVAPGFAITGTILAADIPAGISNAAYATNAGKAGLATNVVPGINTTNETANNITIVSGSVPASTLTNIISSNNLPSDLQPLTVDNGGGLTNMPSASVSGRAAETAISGGSLEYFSLTGNTNSPGITSVSIQTACPFGRYISNINFASCYAAPGQGANTNLVLRFVTNGVIDNGYSLVITGSTTGFLFASDTSSSVSISGITNLFIAVSNTAPGPTSPTLTWNVGFYK